MKTGEEAKGNEGTDHEENMDKYGKISVSLDGVKATTMQELRNKHYDTTVSTLIETVQDYWVKEVSKHGFSVLNFNFLGARSTRNG